MSGRIAEIKEIARFSRLVSRSLPGWRDLVTAAVGGGGRGGG